MTLQILDLLLLRDNPEVFYAVSLLASLFTTIINLGFKYCFFHCYYWSQTSF